MRVLSRLASLVIIGKLAHRLLRGRNYEQTTAYVSLRVLPYLGNHGRLLLNSVANSAFVVPVGKGVPTSRAQRIRSYLKTQIFSPVYATVHVYSVKMIIFSILLSRVKIFEYTVLVYS